MRKHIIFGILIVVALLSFGMSDSKDKELNLPTIEQMEEERKLREIAIRDSINQYHDAELDRYLDAIGFRESVIDTTLQISLDIWVNTNLVNLL